MQYGYLLKLMATCVAGALLAAVLLVALEGVSYLVMGPAPEDPRLKRLECALDGGSADVIPDWTIKGRDQYGVAVSSPESATQIQIRFEARSLIGEDAEVEQSYWEASFFPPLLQ